ncbi:DUF2252 family protein, partial [Pseudomonas sp.]|uniref:DUF2252 family protein n=3 Tax=Pseudomonas TaxID=286 RepID=UPI003FD71127
MSAEKKKTIKSKTKAEAFGIFEPVFRSRKERLRAGESLLEGMPHSSHAVWKPPRKHRDPIDILEESNRYRLASLVPVRYGRMLRSPFTFLRGSSGLM